MLHHALYRVPLHATGVTDEQLLISVDGSGRITLTMEGALVLAPASIAVVNLFATVVKKERADRKDRPLSILATGSQHPFGP